MALADTGRAIGAVTQLIAERLGKKTGLNVTDGRPEPSTNTAGGARLNIFLYEAEFDPSLKNVSLDDGQPTPLWLVLHYLVTAFDENGESDTHAAHALLGEGARALQESSFLSLNSNTPLAVRKALKDSPEELKITFDAAPADLLSKLMQGSDEAYRLSLAFQARPVMIATGEPPSYSLLVGMDYTETPVNEIGEDGVQIEVTPSLGASINEVSPSKFQADSTLTISGTDLHLSGLVVRLGPLELAATDRRPDKLTCLVNAGISAGTDAISAGSHPLAVVQHLPSGRRRSSNLLVVDLVPTLTSAVEDSIVRVDPTDPESKVVGNIDLAGALLGTERDDIFVALYREGKTVKVFDAEALVPPPVPPSSPQSKIRLEIRKEDDLKDDSVPHGKYRVILRVNGQQARNSPEVELEAP